jgi:hypothetical protein
MVSCFLLPYSLLPLTRYTAARYNNCGDLLPPGAPPPIEKEEAKNSNNWGLFGTRLQFETADFLYHTAQMSEGDINEILQLWSGSILEANANARGPFTTHCDLYKTIDRSSLGEVPWQSFSLLYKGTCPDSGPTPTWMTSKCKVWFRDPWMLIHNMFSNPDFIDSIDYVLYHEYVQAGEKGNYCFHNFMSGDWAWKQAVSVCFLLMVSQAYRIFF